MNRIILISLSTIMLVVAILLLVAVSNCDNAIVNRVSDIFGGGSKELLVNSDFANDFKAWKKDKNVTLLESNDVKYVCIENTGKGQTRFWQTVNVVSGKTYKLTFKLSGPRNGAFTIFRNARTGKEQYKWCNGENNGKLYVWNLRAKENDNYQIYLTSNKKGKYCYSNISFKQEQNDNIDIYRIIAIILILLASVLLSRFNIYLTIFILTVSIIPIIKINSEARSDKENRNLAQFKPIIMEGKINTSFGSDFNEWLNDRFFGRLFLMAEYRDLKYFFDRRFENKRAIQGKDGWLFEKINPNNFLPIDGIDKIISDKILALQSRSEELGIKIIFASIPEKNNIYGEFNYFKSNGEKLSEQLSQNKDLNFIYLLDELRKEKENGLLYFKDDHHWTEHGAFVYSKKIIECYRRTNPELPPLDFDNFSVSIVTNTYTTSISYQNFHEKMGFVGSIRNLLNLDNYLLNFVSYYEIYRNKKYTIPRTEFSKSKLEYSKYVNRLIDNKLKIMVIGDSNISFMIPFFTSSFQQCLFLQSNVENNYGWDLKRYTKLINEFKPNFILIIVRSMNLKRWENLSNF